MDVFTEWCTKLKVIISEIDGIVTEDLLYIDELGNVPFKKFCKKDFEVINELKKTFTFVFLSTDNSISYHLCRRKNIPFFYAPKDKKESLIKVMRKYGVAPEEVLYIGCSLSDLECIRMIPFSMCPIDATSDVKTTAFHVLDNFSGEGVLCSVHDLLKPEIKSRKINT